MSLRQRTVDVFDIQNWFSNSKEGQAIIAGKEEAELAAGRVYETAAQQARAEWAERKPALDAAQAKAEAALAKCQQALVTAQAAVRQTHLAQSQSCSARDVIVMRAESALRQSANPRVAEFATELQDRLDRDRHMQVLVDEQKEYNGRTDTYDRQTATSGPNLRAYLAALRAILDEVRTTWPLEVLSEAEIDERITRTQARVTLLWQQAHVVVRPPTQASTPAA